MPVYLYTAPDTDDSESILAVAHSYCHKCKELVPASDAYPIQTKSTTVNTRYNRESYTTHLWCFKCIQKYFWETRRINVKRFFGQLYYI